MDQNLVDFETRLLYNYNFLIYNSILEVLELEQNVVHLR